MAAPLGAQSYSAAEEAEMAKWLAASQRLAGPDAAPLLDELNSHLAGRTTLLGAKPSRSDVAVFRALAPLVARWSPDERSGERGRPHIVRLLDFVQNSPLFGLDEPLISVDLDDVRYVKPPVDAKAEKERLKKEKAAAGPADATLVDRSKEKPGKAEGAKAADADAAAADRPNKDRKERDKKEKDKKEKAPKQQKSPTPAPPLSPALIDLRVGCILKAVNHPDADSLYVSTIAMGDPPGDDTTELDGHVCRTVCSGLNGLVPLADMQGRNVVVVCNLKPVKMRGIKSSAMVLAASPCPKHGDDDDHAGPVELVTPPADAKAGDRVFFEGWRGHPDGQLNPKKIWETLQPAFTTDALEVAFDAAAVEQLGKTGLGRLVTEAGGVCTVQTLRGAVVR